MGYDKFFRNTYTKGTATVAGTLSVTGVATFTAAPVMSAGSKTTVQTVTSTATTLNAYGITSLASTVAGTKKYKLANPVAGQVKYIVAGTLSGSSALRKIIVNTTGHVFSSTNGASNKGITFSAAGESVTLVALTTARWHVVSNIGTTNSTTV